MNSLLTLITSRKTQRALLGIVTTLTTLYFSWPTLTPEGRRTAVIAAEVAIAGLLSADIVGIAHEDAAKATATGSAAAGGDPPTVTPPAEPAPPAPTQPADAGLTPAQQQHVATIARQQILLVIQNAQKQKQQAQTVAETLTPAQPQQPTP